MRVVLEATEFFVEKPLSLAAQYLTWSDYKFHNTFRIVVGVAPNGLVTFLSWLWGGRASDRHIVDKDCDGLIPLLEPGDIVLVGKDFTIGDLPPEHCGLNIPPRIPRAHQMTK